MTWGNNYIYVKSKKFLRNFLLLAIVTLGISTLSVISIYMMSVKVLRQEIEHMNQSINAEINSRVQDVLLQCERIAGYLSIEESVQFFFSHNKPEFLLNNYYEELSGKLVAYGIDYIDSIVLYAPQYEKFYSAENKRAYTLNEICKMEDELFDVTWLQYLDEIDHNNTIFCTRAKYDKWPYLISVIKHYQVGTIDGVVVVNINLYDLYEYLIADREKRCQLFVVDDQNRVIIEASKNQMNKPIEEISILKNYHFGETYNETILGDKNYVYSQSFLEKYKLMIVTVMETKDYLRKMTQMQWIFCMIEMGVVLIGSFLAYIYSVRTIRPIQEIKRLLNRTYESEEGDIEYHKDIIEIADQLMNLLHSNENLKQELDTRLNLLKETQMVALQSQINPHFLFNTLNLVSVMAESSFGDEHPISEIVTKLAEILRYCLKEKDNVKLYQEIEYTKRYIEIMQYRFNNIEATYLIDEKVKDYIVPKMILQPILENTIQHGFSVYEDDQVGSLKIIVQEISYKYRNGNERCSIRIDIQDNGTGIDLDTLNKLKKNLTDYNYISRQHIGLSNVAHRLYLLFQDEHQVIIDSTFSKGTHVSLIFPAISSADF